MNDSLCSMQNYLKENFSAVCQNIFLGMLCVLKLCLYIGFFSTTKVKKYLYNITLHIIRGVHNINLF